MAARKVQEENFSFGPWEILSKKGPILRTIEADKVKADLGIPDIPEMVFGDTLLQIQNKSGFSIVFNAIDALDRVDKHNDLMKVSVAEEWQKQRSACEFIKNVVKPYDWTYTTDYKGTLKNTEADQEEMTEERIDIEKLKKTEKIHFYQDLLLFEDELGDHGISKLNIKIRVMPSSFLILMRFFLRVDGVMIRIHDTRLYHEAGSNYILREYREKEKSIEDLPNPLENENLLIERLDTKKESFHKLLIEKSTPNS